jgi:hypothetical protein
MFSKRGYSYSTGRRRRHRGARRRRRPAPALILAIAVAAISGVAFTLVASTSSATRTDAAAPTPIVPGAAQPTLAAPEAAQQPPPAPAQLALATLAATATALPARPPTVTLVPTLAPTVAPTAQPPRALLPSKRILSYYGNPLAKEMGILGELPSEQMLSRLKQQIAAYAKADPSRPFLPALELVTPAAQGWAGEDGLYRARMKPEVIDQVATWAEANDALLILDVQIGLSTVPQEVDALLPYLRRPYVHLALDPEFAIPSGHIPGEVVGTLDASTIDGVERTLSELVASEHLPPKILIIHRFTDSMVTNSWEIAHSDPNVQIVVTMDGFGPPALKLAQYRSYVHDQGVEFSGIKLFYHHDDPLLTPKDVLGLDPSPDLIIYQ